MVASTVPPSFTSTTVEPSDAGVMLTSPEAVVTLETVEFPETLMLTFGLRRPFLGVSFLVGGSSEGGAGGGTTRAGQ